MPTFPVRCGVFAGMSQAQLEALLVQAQTAYAEVMLGNKLISLTYTQGDGNKAVTKQVSTPAQVLVFMMMVQQALGMCCARRRPNSLVFS